MQPQVRRTISVSQMVRERAEVLSEVEALSAETEQPLPTRPRTRADCIDGPRPCPWVSCRFHLCLEVVGSGAIRLANPDVSVEDMAETCALDVADRTDASDEDMTLAEIGRAMNLTRERVRQIVLEAIAHARENARRKDG